MTAPPRPGPYPGTPMTPDEEADALLLQAATLRRIADDLEDRARALEAGDDGPAPGSR